jgi:Hint domain
VAEAILAGQAGGRPAPAKDRAGAGMATYRLGFYGFDQLAFAGGAGHGAVHPVAAPGARFQLSGSQAVLTPLLVETRDAGDPGDDPPARIAARIAAGSGFGAEGQVVDLVCQLTAVGEDMPAHRQACQVLTVDGGPVGLLTAEPLQPGVAYRVTDATATDPAAGIDAGLGGFARALAAPAPAPPGEVVFCFTSGTRVDTPDGPRRIEDLAPGDLVTTLGNGSQPLRWVGLRHVPAAEMLMTPDLQPVEFGVGVIGNTCPLRVSPQHRILLNDWRAQVFFGEDEVLIPAKAMVNGRTVRPVLPAEGVTYVHLLFDRHEIIVSEGALSESFHPGETGLEALDDAQRREVERLFPGLEISRRRAAFPIVKLTEARAIRLPD